MITRKNNKNNKNNKSNRNNITKKNKQKIDNDHEAQYYHGSGGTTLSQNLNTTFYPTTLINKAKSKVGPTAVKFDAVTDRFGKKVFDKTKAYNTDVMESANEIGNARTVTGAASSAFGTLTNAIPATGLNAVSGVVGALGASKMAVKGLGSGLMAANKVQNYKDIGSKVKSGAKTVGSKTIEGAKIVGSNVSSGANIVGTNVSSGAMYVGSKTIEGAKIVGSNVKSGVLVATTRNLTKKLEYAIGSILDNIANIDNFDNELKTDLKTEDFLNIKITYEDKKQFIRDILIKNIASLFSEGQTRANVTNTSTHEERFPDYLDPDHPDTIEAKKAKTAETIEAKTEESDEYKKFKAEKDQAKSKEKTAKTEQTRAQNVYEKAKAKVKHEEARFKSMVAQLKAKKNAEHDKNVDELDEIDKAVKLAETNPGYETSKKYKKMQRRHEELMKRQEELLFNTQETADETNLLQAREEEANAQIKLAEAIKAYDEIISTIAKVFIPPDPVVTPTGPVVTPPGPVDTRLSSVITMQDIKAKKSELDAVIEMKKLMIPKNKNGNYDYSQSTDTEVKERYIEIKAMIAKLKQPNDPVTPAVSVAPMTPGKGADIPPKNALNKHKKLDIDAQAVIDDIMRKPISKAKMPPNDAAIVTTPEEEATDAGLQQRLNALRQKGGGGKIFSNYGARNFDQQDAIDFIIFILKCLYKLNTITNDIQSVKIKNLLRSKYLSVLFSKIDPSQLNRLLPQIELVTQAFKEVIDHLKIWLDNINKDENSPVASATTAPAPAATTAPPTAPATPATPAKKISNLKFLLISNAGSLMSTIIDIIMTPEQLQGNENKIANNLDRKFEMAFKLPSDEEKRRIENYELMKALNHIFNSNDSSSGMKFFKDRISKIDTLIDTMKEGNIHVVVTKIARLLPLIKLTSEGYVYSMPAAIKEVISSGKKDQGDTEALLKELISALEIAAGPGTPAVPVVSGEPTTGPVIGIPIGITMPSDKAKSLLKVITQNIR